MVFDHMKRSGVSPAMVALAVAIFGILAMLIVDHGPWSRPHVHTAQVADHMTTGQAAHDAGAAVARTAPKSALEPDPLGPKRAEPANPEPE
jgi:hypothetical protein